MRLLVAQILWTKQTLCDFGLKFDSGPILCDNTTTINLTKHINIRHHFIGEQVQNEHIILNNQLAYVFIKPLNEEIFL